MARCPFQLRERSTRIALGLAVLVGTLVALPGLACTCSSLGQSWADVAARAPLIVVGEVVENRETDLLLRVEQTLRGIADDEIRIFGDQCIGNVLGLDVGERFVFAVFPIGRPGEFAFDFCSPGILIAIGDRAYGGITGKSYRELRSVLESLPICELIGVLPLYPPPATGPSEPSRPMNDVCTDDGEKLLSTPLGRFVAARPLNAVVPEYGRDCSSAIEETTARILVDDRGHVIWLRGMRDAPPCTRDAIGKAIANAKWRPATSDGRPVGAYVDLALPLPYVAPTAPCGSRAGVREQTVVWVREGHRNVITTTIPIDRVDISALGGVANLEIQPVWSTELIAELDFATAPEFVEFRDYPPCEHVREQGHQMGVSGCVIRGWKASEKPGCVAYGDGSAHCRETQPPWGGRFARPARDPRAAARISFDSDRFVFDPAMFEVSRTDFVLILVTPGSIVEPTTERVIEPPIRPVLPASVVDNLSEVWRVYLGDACHEPRAVVYEYGHLGRMCGICGMRLDMEWLVELGASWLAGRGPRDLGVTRYRIVSGNGAMMPLALTANDSSHFHYGVRFFVRHDADSTGDCTKAVEYSKRAADRRAEEEEALRTIAPSWQYGQ